eukprot:4856194-Pyramimonas_sp.AAC.1
MWVSLKSLLGKTPPKLHPYVLVRALDYGGERRGARPGIHVAVKPLLSRYTTGELLNSPPNYFTCP